VSLGVSLIPTRVAPVVGESAGAGVIISDVDDIPHRNDSIHLVETWGRAAFQRQSDPVDWGLRLLRKAARGEPSLAEVELVIQMAQDRRRWKEAKRCFRGVRRRVIAEQGGPITSQSRLLNLAELVAKVIYNETDPPDPFDPDTGWWLAPMALDFARARDDPGLEEWVIETAGSLPEPR
jgi:hypothetical protein